MTIRQQGGVFGRHPSFSSVTAEQIAISGSGSFGGNVSVNGNVVLASGSGVDFSATSGTGTSELFDDYEEGAWTPVPADASSGGNVGSAAPAAGSYVKIGKMVYLNCSLRDIDTTGLTSGNDFFIRGLPYVAGGAAGYRFDVGSLVASGGISFSGVLTPTVFRSYSSIRLAETVSGASFDYATVSQINSGYADLYFTLVYETS